jgi:hypothetical protein
MFCYSKSTFYLLENHILPLHSHETGLGQFWCFFGPNKKCGKIEEITLEEEKYFIPPDHKLFVHTVPKMLLGKLFVNNYRNFLF